MRVPHVEHEDGKQLRKLFDVGEDGGVVVLATGRAGELGEQPRGAHRLPLLLDVGDGVDGVLAERGGDDDRAAAEHEHEPGGADPPADLGVRRD